MKKLIYCALALAAGLFATSCMQENLEPVQGGSTVTYTVNVPEVATKAIGDGSMVDQLVYAVYRIKDNQTTEQTTEQAAKEAIANSEVCQFMYQKTQDVAGKTSTIVPLELINNQRYIVLFWAQNTNAWFDVTKHNLGSSNIAYPNDYQPNNDKYDAFTNVDYIEVNGAASKNITLTRPFGQLNIATNLPSTFTAEVNKTTVSVMGLAHSYNVATKKGSVTTNTTVAFAEAAPLKDADAYLPFGNYSRYISMNYVFVEDEQANVAVTYDIETTHGKVSNTINSVPVKKNYKTNIVGNLLTSNVDYNVTLEKGWGTPNEEIVLVNTASGLQEAIEKAEPGVETEIKLDGDIDLSALIGATTFAVTKTETARLPIVIPEGKAFTLDLNGFTISTPLKSGSTTDHYYAFENHGTLTIVDSKGEGSIKARGNFNYGKMILESGIIDAIDGNGGYGVRNYEGAEFVMNGGAIVTSLEDDNLVDDGGYDATTFRVDERATATINAGTINNICDYTFAIDNYGTVTVNGGTFTSIHSTVSTYGTMTINGGSFACNGIEGITAHCLVAWEDSETTIKGGTFDGKDNFNGFNVDACKGSVVNIEGGKFLPVHSGSLYGEGTIHVTGGEFFDDPSERVADGYPVNAPATEGGYYTIGEFTPVAKIGDVEYGSLQAAFNAGGEVTLIADLEVKETVILAEGKEAVLDLNGKTITSAYQAGSDSKHIYPIDNYGELTIIDKVGNGSINGRGIYNQDGARLTINAAKVIGQDWNGGACVWSYGGEVYLHNATFIGNTGCVSSKGYLEINGGTYTCYSGIADNGEQKTSPTYNVRAYNDLKITDGTFTSRHGVISMGGGKALLQAGNYTIQFNAATTSNVLYIYEDAQAIINGGSYISDNSSNKADSGTAILVSGTDAAATVYGGTFVGMNGMVSGNVTLYGGTFNTVWNYNHYDNLADRIAEGYKATQNEDGSWTVSVDPVAMIGEKNYFSLQAAIDAVQEDDTIVLMKDINVETPAYGQNALNYARAINFTLDLNGKTLSANTGNSVFRYNITQAGATDDVTVTIKNGTITAGAGTWCVVMAAGLSADVRAVYNLEDLTINASKPGDLAVKAWDYALINAKNVTVNATKGAGGFYALGGEIVLDNCTVNQEGLWTAPYLSMAVAVSNGGKAIVNSGTYTAVPTAASEGYNQGTSHGSWAAGVMNSGGELIINGGTFANGNFGDDALATAARGLIFGDTASRIEINNGTFNALKSIIDYQNNLGVQPNPNIIINGGDFSADPSVVASYGGVVIKEGYAPTQGANGRWTLVQK